MQCDRSNCLYISLIGHLDLLIRHDYILCFIPAITFFLAFLVRLGHGLDLGRERTHAGPFLEDAIPQRPANHQERQDAHRQGQLPQDFEKLRN